MESILHPFIIFRMYQQLARMSMGVLRAGIQGHSAFVKIADGCRRPCAFCAIPLIKGTAVSRPSDVIVNEARQLSANGNA